MNLLARRRLLQGLGAGITLSRFSPPARVGRRSAKKAPPHQGARDGLPARRGRRALDGRALQGPALLPVLARRSRSRRRDMATMLRYRSTPRSRFIRLCAAHEALQIGQARARALGGIAGSHPLALRCAGLRRERHARSAGDRGRLGEPCARRETSAARESFSRCRTAAQSPPPALGHRTRARARLARRLQGAAPRSCGNQERRLRADVPGVGRSGLEGDRSPGFRCDGPDAQDRNRAGTEWRVVPFVSARQEACADRAAHTLRCWSRGRGHRMRRMGHARGTRRCAGAARQAARRIRR